MRRSFFAILMSIWGPLIAGAQSVQIFSLRAPSEATSADATPQEPPRAHLYLPKASSSAPIAALVICPGGGYGGLAMDHEGDQIAKWANEMGMAGIICEYRHRGNGVGHPVPLQDAQRAIRLVRAQAREWGIDPQRVGILGFSAGGHLASSVLTHFDRGDSAATDVVARESCRPDFGILCYPVIGMGKSYTHEGSQRNLLGENPTPEMIRELSNEEQVTAETPPTFLWHTYEDDGVLPENSIQFYLAMVRHQVPGELHVFEKGKHGIGLGKDVPATRAWSGLCEQWLRARGIL